MQCKPGSIVKQYSFRIEDVVDEKSHSFDWIDDLGAGIANYVKTVLYPACLQIGIPPPVDVRVGGMLYQLLLARRTVNGDNLLYTDQNRPLQRCNLLAENELAIESSCKNLKIEIRVIDLVEYHKRHLGTLQLS